MARRIIRSMFPGGTDVSVLRRGDECDRGVMSDVLGIFDKDMDSRIGNFDGGKEDLIQNTVAYEKHRIGDIRLYHTFARDMGNEPYRYCGLCPEGENGNMHPRASQKVFIISQHHASEKEEQKFNDKFAAALARNEFLYTGDIPILPHLYFPQFLFDDGFERDFGMEAGHLAMDMCDRVIMAVIDGRITEGMKSDVDYATVRLGLKPDILEFTRIEAEEYVRETEESVDVKQRGEGQH